MAGREGGWAPMLGAFAAGAVSAIAIAKAVSSSKPPSKTAEHYVGSPLAGFAKLHMAAAPEDGRAGTTQSSPTAIGASTEGSPRSAPPSARKPSIGAPADSEPTGVSYSLQASLEEPWKVSHGEAGFNLGTVSSTGLRVSELLLLDVPHLRKLNPEADAHVRNVKRGEGITAAAAAAPGQGALHGRSSFAMKASTVASAAPAESASSAACDAASTGFISFTRDDSVVVGDIVRSGNQRSVSRAYLRAGPREFLYFKPQEVRAAIITCGGLCPGMNNVIRELVATLWDTYGVRTIYGIERGYWGFHVPDVVGPDAGGKGSNLSCPKTGPVLLTPSTVADIHHYGGTMLGSDRGGDDADLAVRFLRHYGVSHLYVIGGDGTHRGADQIFRKTQEAGVPIVVCGLPKTIDNDVGIIDRSFGFDSAVAEAQVAIQTAKVEASGAPNGISVVKLMGRFAGFIAAHASLASGDVDLCLIPEVPIVTEGPASILAYLQRVVSHQGHAVVVVAEGAGEEILTAEKLKRGEAIETDAGGNRKLPPILPWLKERISSHFAAAGSKANVRAVDPSYMIRSVPANPADSIYCTLLAQSAVHGAMAGYTGFSVGLCNNRMVWLPITAITANSPRRLNPRGRTYERLLLSTGQPDPLADPAVVAEWRRWEEERGLSAAKIE